MPEKMTMEAVFIELIFYPRCLSVSYTTHTILVYVIIQPYSLLLLDISVRLISPYFLCHASLVPPNYVISRVTLLSPYSP